MRLIFTVALRPVSANNLYPGKTHRYASMEGKLFKAHIHDAALRAADAQGWDLCYAGPASIVIIDYRKDARGVDWDGAPKAIQDALQPPTGSILLNDREVWAGRVYVVVDPHPRIMVIVTQTTRAAIAAEVESFLTEVASVV